MSDSPPADVEMSKRAAVLKLAALAVIVGGALLLASRSGLFRYRDPVVLAAAIRSVGLTPSVAAIFVLGYIAATAIGLPGTPLTLAGGAIFGLAWGGLLNWLGATLGATAAYALAHRLGKGAIGRLLGARAARLDALSAEHGFTTVLRLRLIPVVPFNALNFGAGLAGVRLRDYVLATAFGILPAMLVYTYFADALVAGVAGAREEALLHVVIAGALLILLTFVPAIARRWRRVRYPTEGR